MLPHLEDEMSSLRSAVSTADERPSSPRRPIPPLASSSPGLIRLESVKSPRASCRLREAPPIASFLNHVPNHHGSRPQSRQSLLAHAFSHAPIK